MKFFARKIIMIGRIKKVTPASEDSMGNLYDFWIDVELERGHEILLISSELPSPHKIYA